jgi:hypothetical protein
MSVIADTTMDFTPSLAVKRQHRSANSGSSPKARISNRMSGPAPIPVIAIVRCDLGGENCVADDMHAAIDAGDVLLTP